MKLAKERKQEKKRINKEMKGVRTDRSRNRRLANKARREVIHAIDPDMNIIIMNQKKFDEQGTEIEVINNKIRAVELDDEIIKATMELCNEPAEVDEEIGKRIDKQIEKERLGMFSKFTNKFKSK